MKKFVLILMAVALTAGVAMAQPKFGVKAGLNLSQISKDSDIDGDEASKMLPGLFVSGHVNFGFGEFFGFQPEVMFSMQGGKQSESGTEMGMSYDLTSKMKLNYINVPLLFEVKPITNFSLFVGPQIGINISKSLDASGTIAGIEIPSDLINEYIGGAIETKTIDFAAVVGVQYAIMNHFLISARYNLGFTPALDYEGVKGSANRVIQIGIGWQF